MNCPNCRHDNANDARFCAQCGASLTQPAAVAPTVQTPTPPAAPAGRRKTGLIALAVLVLLLFAAGTIAAFRLVASRAGKPTPGDTQTTARQ
ncbi:MAG TPA: zinc ribbon domain-containing protein, partial [Vicinamibacterales bacterium]|nr:zinc ribbon domain-containing protein [Vicinamibacterales bacterium]